MELEDYRLKLALGQQLKADRVNVGKLCRRDTKLWRTRVIPKPKGKVLGTPLVELVKSDPVAVDGLVIPRLLDDVGKAIRENISTEGLFRLNGSSARIKALKVEVDDGGRVHGPVHDQTGFLKAWLREMPEPLLTYQFYEAYIKAFKIRNDESRLNSVLMLCLLLPTAHLHTLVYLARLLREISMDPVNRMTNETLASILTPNIIKPLDVSAQRISSTREIANHAACVGIVSLLITHADVIGQVPMGVVDAASAMDDAVKAERKYNKLISGKKGKWWQFKSSRRGAGRARSASVSVRTLNLLKQSERDLDDQHLSHPQRTQTNAFEYSNFLELRNGQKRDKKGPGASDEEEQDI